MEKNNTEVKVIETHQCNFCDKPAAYDGKTKRGPWAWMCENHFAERGVGLGLGYGQRLILVTPEELAAHIAEPITGIEVGLDEDL